MKNPDQTCSILPFQRHFNFWFPGILSLAQNKHGPQQQQQVERPWIVASMMPSLQDLNTTRMKDDEEEGETPMDWVLGHPIQIPKVCG